MFGKDIYWYGVQAISLLESGKLHSPDNSPVFHIVAFLFRIFGVSDETLFLFQILTSVWLTVSLFLARSSFFRFPLSAINATDPDSKADINFSQDLQKKKLPHLFFLPSVLVFVLAFLYPKQSWALGFLILSLGFYSPIPTKSFLFSASSPSSLSLSSTFLLRIRLRWIASGVFFLFALWFHPMVALLGLGILILHQIPEKFYPVCFSFVFLLPFFLPEDPSGRFYSDKEIFPLSAAFSLAGLGILWDWTFLVFGTSEPKFKKMRKTFAFFGFLLLLPVFHFADIQYRILLSLILLVQIFSKWNSFQILVWLISTGLWIFTMFTNPYLFRYSYEKMWIPGESIASVPNNGLLVAHHGFCEYYHFQFRKDCLSFEPDTKAISELPKDTEIYRAVYGIRYENLLASKDENKNPFFSSIQPLGEYQLVLEKDWKRYRSWLEKRNSKLVLIAKSWKNPYKERPNFIKRKHSNDL
ncbi:hypothetical protein CLV96_2561 [Leptospira meyeri]|uniref:Dolichyl-phosphate-mannose-protein mannosyltransferase n=1 Tax=Leptospira meyeri TaxID=29508 RepID=A0A4R8MZ25_LEPME|nr:hypothetical protein [Leptospira meyeri]EKJ86271.1 putative membrane protein [Leptospira meyeri serovar Hardjo str. Went 5]TDY73528.1 hypothetical protein CLV96_2561 [Leptospira meyeri]